jgi:polyphosphate kinase
VARRRARAGGAPVRPAQREILPALAQQGIRFLRRTALEPEQAEWMKDFFFNEMMPVLTPIGLDPAHPFPNVLNKSLNFAVELSGKDAFGRNSARPSCRRPRAAAGDPACRPRRRGEFGFVFLSSILHAHVGELFAGMEVTRLLPVPRHPQLRPVRR